jgi:S1-C subfamily serine protease
VFVLAQPIRLYLVMMFFKRLFRLVVLLLAASTPLSAQIEPPLTTQEVVARVTPSTVLIFGDTGLGSGVVVSASGHIVTNFHVVEDQPRLFVQFPDAPESFHQAERVSIDREHDLALLRIAVPNLIPAPLGDATRVVQGEDVVVIGNPQGLSHTVSNGILTGFEIVREGFFSEDSDVFLADGTRLFQTDAATSQGNSGGGMFNDRAELIGIMTFVFTEGQNLNFAVPVNYVITLLADRGIPSPTDPPSPNPLSPITPSPNNVNEAPTATPPTESVDAGRPTSAMANTRSWRSALVLLPILILLVAWFLRQQQEGS